MYVMGHGFTCLPGVTCDLCLNLIHMQSMKKFELKAFLGEHCCSVNFRVDVMLHLVCLNSKIITRTSVFKCDGLWSEHLLCLFWRAVICRAGQGGEVHISHVWGVKGL